MVTIEDITSRVQTEENLRTTLNSIGDAVISTDIKGKIVRINHVAENLTGWNKTDAINKPLGDVFKIINSKTRNTLENPVAKVLKNGQIIGLTDPSLLISKDGSEYQIADSASPIQNEEGDLIGVVLVFRDVTEEYRIVEELKQSEYRFRDMAQMLPVAVIEYDLRAKLSFANKKAYAIFGYQEAL